MPTTVEEIQAIVRDRQRARGPALDARAGPQQRLRRPRPARERLGHRLAAQHEPGPRDQRGAAATRSSSRACAGSTSTRRSRPAGTSSCSRSPTSAGAASSATRSTTARPTCPTGVDLASAVRHGGRAAERRAHAHGHGRDGGQQGLAQLQARPRARRPTSMFMQSNFGIVTKMGVWLMPEPEVYMPLWLRLPKDDDLAPADRHAAHAHARRHDPHGPADHERARCSASVLSERAAVVRRARAPIPEDVDRPDGAGAGHRALDDALRALRRRGGRRPPLREDQGRVRAAIPGADVWGTKYDARGHPDLEHPGERVQGGVPTLDLNEMTAWYGGEEGGHIGFSPVAPLTGHDALRSATSCAAMMEERAAWTTWPRSSRSTRGRSST